MNFEDARAQFPVLERIAFLNAGTFGPLSLGTAAAVRTWLDRDLGEGRSGMPYFGAVLELRDRARAALAGLVGVDPSLVALTASTTDGCNIVVSGLGLGPDDEIVTTSSEHFGMLGALSVSGARVVVVDPEPDAILAAVTPRTRLLALSHVLWTTGEVLPVHHLREQTGIPVLVDGAQSIGAIPVAAAGVDFLTISGQKWLCGPDSTGALVVADPERLRVGRPGNFAQASHDPDGSFVPRDGAQRFEPNWISLASLSGLGIALAQVPEWRYERASALAERLRELLAGAAEVVTPAERATLVAFRPLTGESAGVVVARLADAGVLVREIPGTGLIRASVGWWSSESDVDRLVEGL